MQTFLFSFFSLYSGDMISLLHSFQTAYAKTLHYHCLPRHAATTLFLPETDVEHIDLCGLS